MSTTFTTIGQALYDLFAAIDITAIYPGGWATMANYPLKEPGQSTLWPAFSVTPVGDNETELDSRTNDDLITYEVYLFDTFENSATTEGKMRRLVDLCRTILRKEFIDATPLGDGAYTIESIAGAWGFDVDAGMRYYRFTIQSKTDEDLF